jgi:hypothetical protein
MALYELEMDADAQDPYTWVDCRIIRERRRELGVDRYLVDVSPAVAAAIGDLPGITKIEVAPDGSYVDDSGKTFVVRSGEAVDRS